MNLIEEAERSSRLSGASARGLLGRVSCSTPPRGTSHPCSSSPTTSTRDLLQHRLEQRARRSGHRARSNAGERRLRRASQCGEFDRELDLVTERAGHEQLSCLPRQLLPDARRRHPDPERRRPEGRFAKLYPLAVARRRRRRVLHGRPQSAMRRSRGRWPMSLAARRPWACSTSNTGSTTRR